MYGILISVCCLIVTTESSKFCYEIPADAPSFKLKDGFHASRNGTRYKESRDEMCGVGFGFGDSRTDTQHKASWTMDVPLNNTRKSCILSGMDLPSLVWAGCETGVYKFDYIQDYTGVNGPAQASAVTIRPDVPTITKWRSTAAMHKEIIESMLMASRRSREVVVTLSKDSGELMPNSSLCMEGYMCVRMAYTEVGMKVYLYRGVLTIPQGTDGPYFFAPHNFAFKQLPDGDNSHNTPFIVVESLPRDGTDIPLEVTDPVCCPRMRPRSSTQAELVLAIAKAKENVCRAYDGCHFIRMNTTYFSDKGTRVYPRAPDSVDGLHGSREINKYFSGKICEKGKLLISDEWLSAHGFTSEPVESALTTTPRDGDLLGTVFQSEGLRAPDGGEAAKIPAIDASHMGPETIGFRLSPGALKLSDDFIYDSHLISWAGDALHNTFVLHDELVAFAASMNRNAEALNQWLPQVRKTMQEEAEVVHNNAVSMYKMGVQQMRIARNQAVLALAASKEDLNVRFIFRLLKAEGSRKNVSFDGLNMCYEDVSVDNRTFTPPPPPELSTVPINGKGNTQWCTPIMCIDWETIAIYYLLAGTTLLLVLKLGEMCRRGGSAQRW